MDRTEPAAGEWREERLQADVPPPRQEPNSTPLSGLLGCFGEGDGIIFFISLGKKDPLLIPQPNLTTRPTVKGKIHLSLAALRKNSQEESCHLFLGWRVKRWAASGGEG